MYSSLYLVDFLKHKVVEIEVLSETFWCLRIVNEDH